MSEAYRYAIRLLKFRPRSEYELHQRLKRRGFGEDIIVEAILRLREQSLINDFEFARIWIESRIKKPLGISRLKQELKIKGVNTEIIEQAIGNIDIKYNEDEIIRELIQRRWEKLGHIQPQKAKRRLFLYLLRRGFPSDKVREAINQIQA
jgi:regulatory protein